MEVGVVILFRSYVNGIPVFIIEPRVFRAGRPCVTFPVLIIEPRVFRTGRPFATFHLQ